MNTINTRLLICIILITIFVLVAGCDQKNNKDLSILKIGILPDENKKVLLKRYKPLCTHLSKSLAIPYKLFFFDNYNEIVESFGAKNIDLAYFGGLTFVQAKIRYNALPLVMRDIDMRFTSYIVAKADSSIMNVRDGKDRGFIFGSRLSTSGHLMVRHFLANQDIVPETFFHKVCYSGAHDTTIEWVRNGKADLGAVNSYVYKTMLNDGRIKKGEFHIVWESPPYANYVWAVQPNLNNKQQKKFRDAFLLLSPTHKQHKKILRQVNAGGFYPADINLFLNLEQIASKMKLLE